MVNYQKLYTILFNSITDALEQIEAMNYGEAKEILVCGQQAAEEQYISGGNEENGKQ